MGIHISAVPPSNSIQAGGGSVVVDASGNITISPSSTSTSLSPVGGLTVFRKVTTNIANGIGQTDCLALLNTGVIDNFVGNQVTFRWYDSGSFAIRKEGTGALLLETTDGEEDVILGNLHSTAGTESATGRVYVRALCEATSGNAAINSHSFFLQTRYWDGAASQKLEKTLQAKPVDKNGGGDPTIVEYALQDGLWLDMGTNNKIRWTNCVLKQETTGRLGIWEREADDATEDVRLGLRVSALEFNVHMTPLQDQGAVIKTTATDGSNLIFQARDNGVGYVQVAKLVSAADAYFSMGSNDQVQVRHDGLITLAEGINVVAGTTTGTQYGTVGGASGQKQAWWGATPVVQPVLATGGGATADSIITVLQTLGLVRQS